MKHKLFLLTVILAVFSNISAQETNRTAFEFKPVLSFPNSADSIKRINPNFPVSKETTSKKLPQTSVYTRPDAKTRATRYFNSAFGLSALAGSGASAIIGTITNTPKEWHGTSKGFGKRFASSYAQGAISQTVTFGISEAFKLDNHFEKSGQTGFGKRFKHVLKSSFATRTEKGKYVPDFPQFIGSYAGNIIAKETWYPKRYTYKDGLKGGTISILSRLGINLVREFLRR
jgi:hypothetical protein